MNLLTWDQLLIVIATGSLGAIPILVGIANAYFDWQPYINKLLTMIDSAVNR